MLAMLAQAAPAYDPESVTPGVIGFAATAIVAIAVCFLLFDMNRRVRRLKYREEVRAEIAAEQAGSAEDATGEADSSVSEATAPEQGEQQR
ncbi:hypothetical protein [Agrococcus jejuensis]|uniref:Uncharacterized protein n=1 Tax=Agrococcus jejuensis TaxID=399736 RepID=A0A1G8FQJ4_9MICO|nr:hypothetical protein [Agrococcus jejuensis]SDH84391.1 hypothetical protein SAMN04489720_2575 [Agrococcus jejuensis]